MFSNIFFLENRSVYEIMWKSIFEPDRPQMKIWHMRIAYGYKHTFRKCYTYCFATVVVT